MTAGRRTGDAGTTGMHAWNHTTKGWVCAKRWDWANGNILRKDQQVFWLGTSQHGGALPAASLGLWGERRGKAQESNKSVPLEPVADFLLAAF